MIYEDLKGKSVLSGFLSKLSVLKSRIRIRRRRTEILNKLVLSKVERIRNHNISMPETAFQNY